MEEHQDQITGESRTGYSATYTYDANGNRATRVLNGVTETYTNDNGDKLTSVTWSGGSKTYGYDAAGRTTSVVTSAGTTTLSYDYEGRVTSISYPGGGTNSFTYNGLDTRVGKVDSGGTKTFMRSGVGVTDPVLSDSAAVYTPGVSERRGSTSKFYGSNHLGTNTVETDSTQAVSATKIYDAFGSLVSSTGSSASPFGFAGKEGYQEDTDSGLKLLGHRYYDSSTGRFITRDPVKDGRNWYTYCENKPIKFSDPTGMLVYMVLYNKIHLLIAQDDESQQVIVAPGFSGGHSGLGGITHHGDGKQVPIPHGTYSIINNPNPTPEHSDWFGVVPYGKDGYLADYINGRGGFRLHSGKTSWGCVTIDKNQDPGEEIWIALKGMILGTKSERVLYTPPPKWGIIEQDKILMTRYGYVKIVE